MVRSDVTIAFYMDLNDLSNHKTGPVACTSHKDVEGGSSVDLLCLNHRVFLKDAEYVERPFGCTFDIVDPCFSSC